MNETAHASFRILRHDKFNNNLNTNNETLTTHLEHMNRIKESIHLLFVIYQVMLRINKSNVCESLFEFTYTCCTHCPQRQLS